MCGGYMLAHRRRPFLHDEDDQFTLPSNYFGLNPGWLIWILDPNNGLIKSLYTWVVKSPKITQPTRIFFHCSSVLQVILFG